MATAGAVRRGVPERVVQHGPQVLLELRRPGALDGPVARVVRPHGQLVHDQPAAVHFEQFHGEDADTSSSVAIRMASCWACTARSGAQAGRRRQHLDADAVALHGLHDRVRRDLPPRRPGDHRGQLAPQPHPLLDDELDPGGQQAVRPRPGRRGSTPRDRRTRRGPPWRPPAGRRPRRRSRPRPRRGRHRPPGRHGHAERGQPLPHGPLVLGEPQRVRAAAAPRRPRPPARGCARAGTCSWSNVTTSQPLANRRSASRSVWCADHGVGGDQRGAVVGRRGQHAQRLAERDGGLVRHAGELAAAHHADDGQTGPGIHRAPSIVSTVSGRAQD